MIRLNRRLLKIKIIIFLVVFLIIGAVSIAQAVNEPFIGPSNYGITGLMEDPTARVMQEGTWHIGISNSWPYEYYYIGFSPYKGLEINGVVTDMLNTVGTGGTGSNWVKYGDYKDKSAYIKYQLFQESKYLPAIAIGVNDPTGTRLFGSEYAAFSKQIYPFDFTIGFGSGRYGSNMGTIKPVLITNDPIQFLSQWFKYSQLFWGVQFRPLDYLAFMMEYDPIIYNSQSDIAALIHLSNPTPLKYNFGLRIMPWDWAEFDLTYQRGMDLGISAALTFDIGHPLLVIYDPRYKELEEDVYKPAKDRIENALEFSGFSNTAVSMSADTLWIEADNDRYFYTIRAVGVVIERIAYLIPDNIQKVYIAITDNGLKRLELETTRADIIDLEENRLTIEQFLYLSKFNTSIGTSNIREKRMSRYYDYDLKPVFEPYLNDPSGFFKLRLGAASSGMILPWKGATITATIEGFPVNTISTVNTPPPMTVRSDFVYYKEQNIDLSEFMIEQLYKFDVGLYAKMSFGILELEYSGLDGELAMPLLGGRILAGVSGSLVKKRDINNVFGFKQRDWKDDYVTSFMNLRINIPEIESYIDVKYGQFLAGDVGARIMLSKYISGVIISAWYSLTDTTIFNDTINNGYHDTGISVTIPFRLFKGHDSNKSFGFAVSPWVRDVAQDISHRTSLFNYIGRDTDIYLEKDNKKMQEN